jgi:hypothetical protein
MSSNTEYQSATSKTLEAAEEGKMELIRTLRWEHLKNPSEHERSLGYSHTEYPLSESPVEHYVFLQGSVEHLKLPLVLR